jgi:hypothetical protein
VIKKASRLILSELNQFSPDIFPYKRKSNKDGYTSGRISYMLSKIFFNKSSKNINKDLSFVRRHCYKDIRDDYELFYACELLYNSTIDSFNLS